MFRTSHMWLLVWDWRAAAVADSEGNILDVEEWDEYKDTDSVCIRMDMIANQAVTPEAEGSLNDSLMLN